jgi:hypothetical protein
MGLLEDAIREHLELKRLRGADPTEVAREQHEALDPLAGQEPTALGDARGHAGEGQTDAEGDTLDGDAPTTADRLDDAPEVPVAGDFSHTAQETAELDMQEVLANEPSAVGENTGLADSELAEGGETPEPEDESLEWEVPARPSHDPVSDPELQDGESRDAASPASDERQPLRESADDLEGGQHPGAQDDASRQGRLSI